TARGKRTLPRRGDRAGAVVQAQYHVGHVAQIDVEVRGRPVGRRDRQRPLLAVDRPRGIAGVRAGGAEVADAGLEHDLLALEAVGDVGRPVGQIGAVAAAHAGEALAGQPDLGLAVAQVVTDELDL